MTAEYNKRNKYEWIEGAAALKHERFEVAGALFDCSDAALLTKGEVARKLDAFLRPVSTPAAVPEQVSTDRKPKRTKEETVNVDSTE
ncbi:hypothetical protein M3661_19980 [Paenibacillus sp. MER 180]|uniref:hypothetical protein n=1 Tax=Paenibacillus sp. MER 180 TaxID=2939570 RepID=UPI00203D4731|nr:hypothetical protein [Paenibacillus sp. MER 180]MCM3292404.1 hypothetical protein [Paenibacillus sp. MER 180]